MRVIVTESQLRKIVETIKDGKVICDNCGWSWELSDGGDDPYICHKCGHDNAEKDFVKLGDVEFRVRQGGKDRVRSEKSKNVHAFVIGDLLDYCEYPCQDIPSPTSDNIITYNPYKHDSFVYKKGGEPIYSAKEVDMINSTNKLFVVKK
jgi:hypothetical protein